MIEGAPGSGEVQLNGAAARLVQRGDRVIIVSYGLYSEDELDEHQPRVVHVDADNRIVRVDADPAARRVAMSTEPGPDTPPDDRPPVTVPQLRRDEAARRADRDGDRLRLPERAGRRGGGRRRRAGRRHGRDDGARLRLHRPGLDGRDADARARRAPRRSRRR